MNLYHHSLNLIAHTQAASGAYPASPSFATYHYSWFRDGAFIATAMDLAGRHDSAARFHGWAAATINDRAATVRRAVAGAAQGRPLAAADTLHTRYAVDGAPAAEAWPNFQLDGLGTWLWSLEQHHRLAGRALPAAWLAAADLAAAYLAALWSRPCYDCWEEFPDQVHTYTLAAIYAGLAARGRLDAAAADQPSPLLTEIKEFLLAECVRGGRFVKYAGADAVDASLLGLALPYGVVPPGDPRLRAAVAEMEATLLGGGGLHRYAADTYYGGGAWVLLTAWLGWYYVAVAEEDKAAAALAWVEAQADSRAHLPEQVPLALNDPAAYEPWRQRWGDIARPLLWSHAKYVMLRLALNEKT